MLVQTGQLGLLSRIPGGSVQTIYLDPPLLSGPQDAHGTDQLVADYRMMMAGLLKHARRALSSSGNLFVRFPARHDHIDMASVLGQVFRDQKPYVITFPGPRHPGLLRSGPRSDRETLFLIQASSEAVYNSTMLAVDLAGASQHDIKGAFRWEALDRPSFSASCPVHEFHGTTLPPGRSWRFSQAKMEELLAQGRIARTSSGRWALKRYADEVPPVEAPLDWDDIPDHAPLPERVPGERRPGAAQEPLALMERLIETGSREGDLVVVLPSNEFGSGAVACHRLRRRWLATFQTPGGLDTVRERLVAEGAAPGVDFGTTEAAEVFGLDEYEVDGTPLLLSADQVIQTAKELDQTAKELDRLRQLVIATFELKFERDLARHLLTRGVTPVRAFRVPGTNCRLNFFLPEPPFGVIEIKIEAHGSHAEGVAQLREYQAALGTGARLYLVLLGGERDGAYIDPASCRGVTVLASPTGDAGDVARTIAADFLSHRVRASEEDVSPTLAAGLAADTDALSATLSTLTLNLDALFLAEGRKVLEHEMRHLRIEISHKHFTAAALRVGRSLEYIIYAACRSWGVPVREPILIGLDKLKNGFERFANSFLAYAALEAGDLARDAAKRRAIKLAKDLQGMMLDVVADVEASATIEPKGEKPTRNLQALVKDISRKYQRLEEVRSALKEVEEPLDQIRKLRNSAAHSSTDGNAREVGHDELQKMLEFLSSILMNLSRCGTAIIPAKQLRGESTT